MEIQARLYPALLLESGKGVGDVFLCRSIGLGGNPSIELLPLGRGLSLEVGCRRLLRRLRGRGIHLERIKVSIYMIDRRLCFLVFVTIRYLVLLVQGKVYGGEHMELPQAVLDSRAKQCINGLIVVKLDFGLRRVYIDIYMLWVYLQVEEVFRLFTLFE